jgi:hypothetical protein
MKTVWTEEKVASFAKFCRENKENGNTLDWCFTNFASGDAKDKYGSRYYANKQAYWNYVKANKPRPTTVTHTGPEITLTQILKYERLATAAGYQFILR